MSKLPEASVSLNIVDVSYQVILYPLLCRGVLCIEEVLQHLWPLLTRYQ